MCVRGHGYSCTCTSGAAYTYFSSAELMYSVGAVGVLQSADLKTPRQTGSGSLLVVVWRVAGGAGRMLTIHLVLLHAAQSALRHYWAACVQLARIVRMLWLVFRPRHVF